MKRELEAMFARREPPLARKRSRRGLGATGALRMSGSDAEILERLEGLEPKCQR